MFKVYEGRYKKTDGEERYMRFVKAKELPVQFLTRRIKGGGKPRTLSEGMELVYDLDVKDFRIFNWKTIIGEVREKMVERLTTDDEQVIKNLDSLNNNSRNAKEGNNNGN